jgi:hypothetical protein
MLNEFLNSGTSDRSKNVVRIRFLKPLCPEKGGESELFGFPWVLQEQWLGSETVDFLGIERFASHEHFFLDVTSDL